MHNQLRPIDFRYSCHSLVSDVLFPCCQVSNLPTCAMQSFIVDQISVMQTFFFCHEKPLAFIVYNQYYFSTIFDYYYENQLCNVMAV